MSTGDWISITVAVVALTALVVAAMQLRLAIVGLRRTSQPVVVVHEVRSAPDRSFGGAAYDVYLRNHGVGTAFNVRFGIEIGGERSRYPFSTTLQAEGRGARQIVDAGARLPRTGELTLSAPFSIPGQEEDTPRAFWARYENGFGETWETSNPHDPAADLGIERVRRRERRRTEQAESRGRLEIENQMDDAAIRYHDEKESADSGPI